VFSPKSVKRSYDKKVEVKAIKKGFFVFLHLHLFLLLFLIPLIIYIPGVMIERPAVVSKELALTFIAASLVMFYLCYALFFARPGRIRLTLTNLCMIVFFLIVIVSSLLSGEASYSLKEARILFLLIVTFFIVQEVIASPSSCQRIRVITVLAGLIVSIYAFFQFIGWDFIFAGLPIMLESTEARAQIFSTIGNPEYLGSYLAAVSMLLIPVLFIGAEKRVALFSALAGVLFYIFIILITGARGAFIGLIIGTFFVLAVCLKSRRLRLRKIHWIAVSIILLIFILIVVIFSFPNPLNPRNLNVLDRFKKLIDLRDDSIKERILFYSVCSEMVVDRPVIGLGAGMFKVKFYPYIVTLVEQDPRAGMKMTLMDLKNRVPENAHNDLLQFWVEYGSLGLFAFLFAVSSHIAFAAGRLARPSHQRNPHFILELSFLGLLVCLLVSAAFSFPLHMPTRAALFWVLFGTSHALYNLTISDSMKNDEQPTSKKPA